MTPIHELLNRIRWDPVFARGDFKLGYFDRVAERIIVVPFRELDFPADESRVFRLMDADGRSRRVPFHRVREVYRDGRRIWQRGGEKRKAEGQKRGKTNLNGSRECSPHQIEIHVIRAI